MPTKKPASSIKTSTHYDNVTSADCHKIPTIWGKSRKLSDGACTRPFWPPFLQKLSQYSCWWFGIYFAIYPNRASDIVRWCDFTQLTSCRIRSHNRTLWGKWISFVKCTVIQTLFLTKNTAALSNPVQGHSTVHVFWTQESEKETLSFMKNT